MKNLLISLLLLSASISHAQLNNSWIDYGKTYFKFQVSKTGLYRINQPVLAASGLAGNAEQFQLWRNGQEIPLFVSVPNGALSVTDYIEFWGKRNDGKPDKNLYRDTSYQLSDSFSLETDTATYFLTLNPTNNNLRFTSANNNIAANTLAPDAYFMRKAGISYNSIYNAGYAALVGDYIYSSSYDIGEGYTSGIIGGGGFFTQGFNNLNAYLAGPANSVSFYLTAFGDAKYPRNLQVKLNSSVIYNNVPLNFFSIIKKQVDNIPLSAFTDANNLNVSINATIPPPDVTNINDRIVVGEMQLTYPAVFNFNNSANFYFELQASAVGNYLEINNFAIGNSIPVLYSISDGQRYAGDISAPGLVKFALPPSALMLRKFYLVNEDAANITTINALSSKTFINFSNTAQQGDYVIITNSSLFNDGNGVNYVDQYKQYRSSVTGGSYHPVIINIAELNDQFAFGIKRHPAAIRDFISYAMQQFTNKPKYVFIIGRGVSAMESKVNDGGAGLDQLDLVQTFGWPASDVLLACLPGQNVPQVPIGRLGVINGTEIKYYLNKVKQYEQAQASTSQTIADKGWMKNAINVAGGSTNSESDLFVNYLNNYSQILQDSAFGGYVETFVKSTATAVQQANGSRIEQLINGGVSVVQYFGHSSANTLAFNLDNPDIYSNQGKYPIFNVSGCSAGNFFIYDPTRLNGTMTLSEKYVLADQRGAIAFIATTHLGIPDFLDNFNTQLYNNLALNLYGNTIGNQLKQTLQVLGANPQSIDFYTRMHMEELNLQGDPAIKVNAAALPDFVVEDPLVKITPAIISVADNNFTLNVKMMNIGKVVNDSIRVSIIRLLPNGSPQVLYNKIRLATKYADSLTFIVPINSITDKGLNKIVVTLDVDNKVAELSKTNNILTKEFYILEDEANPVSPYNYSIVNNQNITFTGTSANPLIAQRQYQMEIDTTQLFNSPFKKQYLTSGIGGIITFKPTDLTFTDSTVYYWRLAMVPINAGTQIWNSFSFVYLPNSSAGFNQSHYFQHMASTYDNTISLDADRFFRFKTIPRTLSIKTGIYPYINYNRMSVDLDFDQLAFYGCTPYGQLQFLVYDTSTLKPWANYNVTNMEGGQPVTTGRFGSSFVCSSPRNFFQFNFNTSAGRKYAMDFMDSIPDGMYVSVSNFSASGNTTFISDWQNDQALFGKNLYDKFKSVGFTQIDSFYHNLPFVFFYKKNSTAFLPAQKMGVRIDDYLTPTFSLPTKYLSGTIQSPAFGPAKNWNSLHWNGKSLDKGPSDSVTIQVIGVTTTGVETLLAQVRPAKDTTLSFINAVTYPYLKLKMLNSDSIFATPYQLNYWRVNADYVPEGAVAPNILYTMRDTVEQGAKINFSLAFKNISTTAFDSMVVKMIITDRNNVPHIIAIPKKKALIAGDTLVVSYGIDTKGYPGSNTLYVMVNPDNAQPEQYFFNNFIFKSFYVKEDKFNPLLDVTFDGVHILNRDIVAAKPHILVKLKDESHFLALSDTSLIKIQVRYPDGTLHKYFFGDSVRFNPANLATGQNTASIDFMPSFLQDGDYQFIVSGKDINGNTAGALQYQVTFSIINKPMISNMLNYPNPFTTSTAFVFTITGMEVPQNLRIQILTITGKVVRDITKDELGPIHIGRNITDFKWDGTDGYGQKVANGVYLYRIITNLNGKSLDKYKSADDNTDKYFNKGYGKMYLMR